MLLILSSKYDQAIRSNKNHSYTDALTEIIGYCNQQYPRCTVIDIQHQYTQNGGYKSGEVTILIELQE